MISIEKCEFHFIDDKPDDGDNYESTNTPFQQKLFFHILRFFTWDAWQRRANASTGPGRHDSLTIKIATN